MMHDRTLRRASSVELKLLKAFRLVFVGFAAHVNIVGGALLRPRSSQNVVGRRPHLDDQAPRSDRRELVPNADPRSGDEGVLPGALRAERRGRTVAEILHKSQHELMMTQCPDSGYNNSLGTTTISPDAGMCWMSVSFTAISCSAVSQEVTTRLRNSSNWKSPFTTELTGARSQTYTNLATGVDGSTTIDFSFQASFDLSTNTYLDKMRLSFFTVPSPDAADGCLMFGCAKSEDTAVGEAANYCNMKVLYCGSDDGCPTAHRDFSGSYTEDYGLCSAASTAQCVTTTTTTTLLTNASNSTSR